MLTPWSGPSVYDHAMRKGDIASLFEHMYWVNKRLLEAAAELPPAALTSASPATVRDLRATLVHELDVEWSWRLNLQGRLTDDLDDLRPEDHPSVESIRERWQLDEMEMRAWLEALTDDELAAEVDSGLSGDRRPLWQYLMHIVIHAAQQQSDAATLLTLAGQSPGELGYGEFLRATT